MNFFLGGVSRYTSTTLIVVLSPGHSDITRFRPWSPIATGNHLDRAEKKIRKLLRRLAPFTFLIRVQVFRDRLPGELPHVQIFMNDGPSPLTWDAQLLSYLDEIRRSSKTSSWIWSIISGVVTVLGRPGRGASRGKIPTFKLGHPVFDGARSPMFVRMAWIFFGALPCRKIKYDSSRLHVVEIARVAWHASFSLRNNKRLAIPTTLSIPSYDIGKYVGLRTYQHPLVTIVRNTNTLHGKNAEFITLKSGATYV